MVNGMLVADMRYPVLLWLEKIVVCVDILKILILDWILFEKIVFIFDEE